MNGIQIIMQESPSIKDTMFHLDDQQPNATIAKRQLAFFSHTPFDERYGQLEWTIRDKPQSSPPKNILPAISNLPQKLKTLNSRVIKISRSFNDFQRQSLQNIDVRTVQRKNKCRVGMLPLHINNSMFRKKKPTVVSTAKTVDLSFSCSDKHSHGYHLPTIKVREESMKKYLERSVGRKNGLIEFKEEFKKLEELIIKEKKILPYFSMSCQI